MSFDRASFFCPRCKKHRQFQSERPNHILHLLATVFLCGVWFIPWIIIAAQERPFFCGDCGYSDYSTYLRTPGLREAKERHRRATAARRSEAVRQLWSRISNWRYTVPISVALIFVGVGLSVYVIVTDSPPDPPTHNVATAPTPDPLADIRRALDSDRKQKPYLVNLKTIESSGDRIVVTTDLSAKSAALTLICVAVAGRIESDPRALPTSIRVLSNDGIPRVEKANRSAPCRVL